MPFINGRYYMNPAYGRAVESERGAESASNQDTRDQQDEDVHWVTINGHHVPKQETQTGQEQHKKGRTQSHTKAPKNSREDVVLIPAESGKPQANAHVNGMWTMRWAPREVRGNGLQPPGGKYSDSQIDLTESVNGGPFKPAGSESGEFEDIISPESRTIIQQFSINGKRVQVVLGRDAEGNLIKTWDVRMTVKYPNIPAYSPEP